MVKLEELNIDKLEELREKLLLIRDIEALSSEINYIRRQEHGSISTKEQKGDTVQHGETPTVST